MLTFYRIAYPDGHFYIGSTTSDNAEKYIRGKCQILSKKNGLDYSFEGLKIEIHTDFSSEQELRNFEHQEIKKYIHQNPLCLNRNLQANCQKQISGEHTCPECGGKGSKHKVGCSLAKRCLECGGINGNHKRACSQAIICQECGATANNHLKSCSRYKRPEKCPECGAVTRHFKTCSKYIEHTCSECGAKDGKHFKTCSKFKKRIPCPECGTLSRHKPTCSKYKEPKRCLECGGAFSHKSTCSKYRKRKNL